MELRGWNLVQPGGLVHYHGCRPCWPFWLSLWNVHLLFGSDGRRVRSRHWSHFSYWTQKLRRKNNYDWKNLCKVKYRQYSWHLSSLEAWLRAFLGFYCTEWPYWDSIHASWCSCRRLLAHIAVIRSKWIIKVDTQRRHCDFSRISRFLKGQAPASKSYYPVNVLINNHCWEHLP